MVTATRKETDTWTDPAIAWLEQRARDFSNDADELRASADRAAKVLSALASTGFIAVGSAKVGAVYPWPSDGSNWVWVIVLFASFLLMVASVVWFVIRFWRANRPLAMSTNPKRLRDVDRVIDERECCEIDRIYKDAVEHAPFTES